MRTIFKYSVNYPFTGYAIIQLPEFLVFLYKYARKIIRPQVPSQAIDTEIVPMDGQPNLVERLEVLSDRITQLEETNVTLRHGVDNKLKEQLSRRKTH